ncbi:hypothetical protein [Spirosoma oryzicola]|uniref:hypothetical protein n=1 Tax=Spirosoma oryzicola TaxID=2898794 RepID=UPI001E55CBB3|nr:hypothetical protein [Spirosoma oryzicola]UHG94698.1 hypothetical protein LQ777_29310 [Spirosoma oryzicola]
MEEIISQRLIKIRKHLGDRLGHELTVLELSELSGIKNYTIQRIESGLKGTTTTLVTLLNFYRSHGYSLDWILSADNARIPMIVASGIELQEVGEMIQNLNRCLTDGYDVLSTRLRSMGYDQLKDVATSENQSKMPDAIGLSI